jgi:hypothetical protein
MANTNVIVIVIVLVLVLVGVFYFLSMKPASAVTSTILTTSNSTTIQINSATQIQILSVTIVPLYRYEVTNSSKEFIFNITLKNIGNEPLYLGQGCHQAIGVAITPANSVEIFPNGAGTCALSPPAELAPGNSTSFDAPSYVYFVANKTVNITATFGLSWYTSNSYSSSTANMSFSKNFTLN